MQPFCEHNLSKRFFFCYRSKPLRWLKDVEAVTGPGLALSFCLLLFLPVCAFIIGVTEYKLLWEGTLRDLFHTVDEKNIVWHFVAWGEGIIMERSGEQFSGEGSVARYLSDRLPLSPSLLEFACSELSEDTMTSQAFFYHTVSLCAAII